MKVLWIVNMVLPNVAKSLGLSTSVSGGWLIDYANKLANCEEIELATMTYANVEKDIDVVAAGLRNFIFSGGGNKLLFDSTQTIKNCKKVIELFQPDIIHIHGTEYAIGKAMLDVNKNHNIPVLLTIQGILMRISAEYYGGLSFLEICKMTTVKELLRFKTPFFAKRLFVHNAHREQSVLSQVKYVTGRTTWDKTVMLSINPNLYYYRFNYNLREEFYAAPKWSVREMTPHTVFIGASSYPLKGIHIMVDAVRILKSKYPDIKVIVPGGGYNGSPKKLNGYQKYILKKIIKNNLQSNFEFIGNKSATEIIEQLRNANVCVVTSAMEGASATICEAMMIGTPCVCAYRGGMTELLNDGESGFYYDFPEYGVLAERIATIFENEKLCMKFSESTISAAENRHNRDVNFNQLLDIYKDVIYKEKHNV